VRRLAGATPVRAASSTRVRSARTHGGAIAQTNQRRATRSGSGRRVRSQRHPTPCAPGSRIRSASAAHPRAPRPPPARDRSAAHRGPAEREVAGPWRPERPRSHVRTGIGWHGCQRRDTPTHDVVRLLCNPLWVCGAIAEVAGKIIATPDDFVR
jgi:hypothetical protein